MFRHILVPVDGSDCSLQALDTAAAFAKEQGAVLSICTVVDPAKAAAMAFGEAAMTSAALDALDEEGRMLVEDAAARIRPIWPADTTVLDGAPVENIVEHAKASGVDLIVIGSHGRSGLPRLLLGSVAEGVIRNAASPVLVVRQIPVTIRAPQTSAKAPAGG